MTGARLLALLLLPALLALACAHLESNAVRRWLAAYESGNGALEAGDIATARAHFEKAHEISQSVLTRNVPLLDAYSLEALAIVDVRDGRVREGIAKLDAAWAVRQATPNGFDASLLRTIEVANELVQRGYLDEGERYYDCALPHLRVADRELRAYSTLVPRHFLRASLAAGLGVLLVERGRPERSLRWFEWAFDLRPLSQHPESYDLAPAVLEYADALEALGQMDEARRQRDLVREVTQGPDYLVVVKQAYDRAGMRAWNPGALPFRVFVDGAPEERPGMDAELSGLMEHAATEWTDSVRPGVPSFEFVDSEETAHIHVRWKVGSPRNPILPGHAAYSISEESKRITRVDIDIDLGEPSDPAGPDRLAHVARHELGHAIGLWGHSPSPADLMYPYLDRGEGRISDRDRSTLRHLFPCGTDAPDGLVIRRRRASELRCGD